MGLEGLGWEGASGSLLDDGLKCGAPSSASRVSVWLAVVRAVSAMAVLAMVLPSGCARRRAAVNALGASWEQRRVACAAAQERNRAAREVVRQADVTVQLAETALAESATRRGERPKGARRGLLYDEAMARLEQADGQLASAKELARSAADAELEACTGL